MTMNLDHLRVLLRPDGVEVKADCNQFVLRESGVMDCSLLVPDSDKALVFKMDQSAPLYLSENVSGLNGVRGLSLRRCCDFGVLMQHRSKWHFLLIELVNSLGNMNIYTRKKVEQLVLGTPSLNHLHSIARLYTDIELPEINYMYFLLYANVKESKKTDKGVEKQERTNGVARRPRPRVLVSKGIQQRQRFYQYGRPGKYIYVLGQQVNSENPIEACKLIDDYAKRVQEEKGIISEFSHVGAK